MKSSSDLEGKIVVITGGAGLIGKGFVKSVLENGGTAIIADIDEISGNEVKDEISKELGTELAKKTWWAHSMERVGK